MKAKDFDKQFDHRKSVSTHLNLAEANKPFRDSKRVNIDLPEWMVNSIDRVGYHHKLCATQRFICERKNNKS